MYERILLPTDGNEHSAAAAEHAFDLAATYGAAVRAVFVVDTGTGALTVSKDEVRDALRDLGREASEEALRGVRERAVDHDVELVTEVLEGKPDERILAYAADNDVDLIVMGTHGRTGLGRRLTGSVTERVVREASVPVMTVKAPSDTE